MNTGRPVAMSSGALVSTMATLRTPVIRVPDGLAELDQWVCGGTKLGRANELRSRIR